MKIYMKKLFKPLAIASIVALSFTTQAQATIELKLAHAAPETDTQHKAAQFFSRLVSERTDGEVNIKIFGNSVLGGDQQLISGVRAGTIDIEMSGNPNFSGIEPRLGAFDLPYIFGNREQAYKVLDGEVGEKALALLDSSGMKGLAFWEVGFRAMTNSKRPILSPDDVKGLKMRTNSNKSLIEAFSLLGANPIPMPIGELYTALETRTVDAQDHPIGIVWSAKFYEVQKYLSLTNQAYTSLIMVMNKSRFDNLNPEYQEVMVQSAKEAGQYQRQLNEESEREIINALRTAGVQVEEKIDTAPFQAMIKPTWDSYIGENGSEWIDAIQHAIAN